MPFVYFGFLFVMAVWLFWVIAWALVWAIVLLAWPVALLVAGIMAWRAYGRRWSTRSKDGRTARAAASAARGNGSVPNTAFDDYREDRLNRLDEEQDKFREFLQRLRGSRDRKEFDQFIAARRGRPPMIEGDASTG